MTDKSASPAHGTRALHEHKVEAQHDLGSNESEVSTNATLQAGADQDASNAESSPATNASPDVEKQRPENARSKLQTTLIVGALCCGLFLAALDTTIVTTAIPVIAAEFASPLGYTWIGSAYLLANAATCPSWGKISDIWGRKPIILLAVAIFWVGSLLCAVSVSMGMLIASRAIQGVGSGGIIVLVNICVGDLFSQRDRGLYYGVMGFVWAIASAVGPVLGGVFTYLVTWRWCFYVNLPICRVSMAVLVFALKLHNPKTPMRQGLAAIDWIGSLLIIGGALMFLLGLEFGGITFPWNSAPIICLILFGVLSIALFFVVESKFAKYPLMPLRLFQTKSSLVPYGVSMCHALVFISGSFYLPLYFQGVLGVTSLTSGLLLLPWALTLSIVSALMGLYMKKIGDYYWAMVFGMGVLCLGFGLFINLPLDKNLVKIILYQVVAGIGVGPIFQAPLIAIQSAVKPNDIASATSLFAFARQLATSISVVIGGVVFQNAMELQQPSLLAELGPELSGQLSGSSATANVGLVAQLPGRGGEVARMAYLSSLHNMYTMFTVIAGLGFLLTPFVKRNTLSKEHTEHKTGLKSLQREVSHIGRKARAKSSTEGD